MVTDAPRVTVVRHAIEEKIQTSKLKKDSAPSAAADSDWKCTVLARRATWEAWNYWKHQRTFFQKVPPPPPLPLISTRPQIFPPKHISPSSHTPFCEIFHTHYNLGAVDDDDQDGHGDYVSSIDILIIMVKLMLMRVLDLMMRRLPMCHLDPELLLPQQGILHFYHHYHPILIIEASSLSLFS